MNHPPSPLIPRHPLDHPGSLKILLGREASAALAAHGDHFMAIVTHPDATSPIESAGRLILTCLPCAKDSINAACRVAMGEAVARPIRRPATAATAATISQPSPS